MKVISEEVEEERKKEVVCEVRVYNSLHWWVSLSELSEKIMQAMKKFFHLQTLLIQSEKTHVNKHWQLYNNLFRSLRHNLEKKKRDDVIS